MSVQFVSGNAVEFLTGASISQAAPSAIQDRDILLAFVMARSAITAPPGWELLGQTNFSGSDVGQILAVYKKTIVRSDNGGIVYSWEQAVPGRMGLSIGAFRGGAITATASRAVNNTETYTIAPDYLAATKNGSMVLAAASCVVTQAVTTPIYTPPSGMTTWTESVPNFRLAAAFQQRDAGQANSGFFIMSTDKGLYSNGLGSITILIEPKCVSGTVYDSTGAPAARTVRALRRDTGHLVGSGLSDGATGAYSINVGDVTGEVQVIALDDVAGTLENDLILRTTPV